MSFIDDDAPVEEPTLDVKLDTNVDVEALVSSDDVIDIMSKSALCPGPGVECTVVSKSASAQTKLVVVQRQDGTYCTYWSSPVYGNTCFESDDYPTEYIATLTASNVIQSSKDVDEAVDTDVLSATRQQLFNK